MMNGTVLDYLSKDRQAQVMKEAMTNVLAKVSGKTLGAMVQWLTKHPQWKALAALPASSLTVPASRAVSIVKSPRVRSRVDIVAAAKEVLGLITKHPGSRSEQLQEKSTLERPVWKRALAQLRDTGVVKTKGHKRASIYFAAGAATSTAPKTKKRPAKKAKKAAKKS